VTSLKNFFGRDDKVFNLLEASAGEAQQSALALKRLLQHSGQTPSLEAFSNSRSKNKSLTQEMSDHVAKSLVTALERDDIEALSHTLYKIPKTIEKFAQRFVICGQYVQGVNFTRQVGLLDQATQEVLAMVRHLRKNSHPEEIREDNTRLQHLEGEADKLVLELLADLYSGRHDVQKVIALKELYELLEKVIDRCRDAGTVVTHIILKHA
jgi:uncharacterized protein